MSGFFNFVWNLFLVLFGGWIVMGILSAIFTSPEEKNRIKKEQEKEAENRNRRLSKSFPDGYVKEWAFFRENDLIEKNGSAIALNQEKKELAIFEKGKWSRFKFTDILGAEVMIDEDRVSHTTGGRDLAGALVGGLAFGGPGMIIGGLGGNTTTKTTSHTKHIYLNIFVHNLEEPIRKVEFFNYSWGKPKISKESATKAAEVWMKRIQIIIEKRNVNLDNPDNFETVTKISPKTKEKVRTGSAPHRTGKRPRSSKHSST